MRETRSQTDRETVTHARWVAYLFGLVAILAVPVSPATDAGDGSPSSNPGLGFGIVAGIALFVILFSLVVWQSKSPPQIKDEDTPLGRDQGIHHREWLYRRECGEFRTDPRSELQAGK
jgi:hypothetical protein